MYILMSFILHFASEVRISQGFLNHILRKHHSGNQKKLHMPESIDTYSKLQNTTTSTNRKRRIEDVYSNDTEYSENSTINSTDLIQALESFQNDDCLMDLGTIDQFLFEKSSKNVCDLEFDTIIGNNSLNNSSLNEADLEESSQKSNRYGVLANPENPANNLKENNHNLSVKESYEPIIAPDTTQTKPTLDFSYLENFNLLSTESFFEEKNNPYEISYEENTQYISNTKKDKTLDLENSSDQNTLNPLLTLKLMHLEEELFPKVKIFLLHSQIFKLFIPMFDNCFLIYNFNNKSRLSKKRKQKEISKGSWIWIFEYILGDLIVSDKEFTENISHFKDPIFKFNSFFVGIVINKQEPHDLSHNFIRNISYIHSFFAINLEIFKLMPTSFRFGNIKLMYLNQIHLDFNEEVQIDVVIINCVVKEIIYLLKTDIFISISAFLPEISSLLNNIDKLKFASLDNALKGMMIIYRIKHLYEALSKLIFKSNIDKTNIFTNLNFFTASNHLRSLFAIFVKYLEIDNIYYKNILSIINIYIVMAAKLNQHGMLRIEQCIDNFFLSINFFELAVSIPEIEDILNWKHNSLSIFVIGCIEFKKIMARPILKMADHIRNSLNKKINEKLNLLKKNNTQKINFESLIKKIKKIQTNSKDLFLYNKLFFTLNILSCDESLFFGWELSNMLDKDLFKL